MVDISRLRTRGRLTINSGLHACLFSCTWVVHILSPLWWHLGYEGVHVASIRNWPMTCPLPRPHAMLDWMRRDHLEQCWWSLCNIQLSSIPLSTFIHLPWFPCFWPFWSHVLLPLFLPVNSILRIICNKNYKVLFHNQRCFRHWWWWHRFWGPVMLFPVFLKWCCKDGNLFASGWGVLVEIMVSYSGLFALRVDTSFAIAEVVWFSLAASGLILEWPGHRLLPYVVSLLVLAVSNLGLDSRTLPPQCFLQSSIVFCCL